MSWILFLALSCPLVLLAREPLVVDVPSASLDVATTEAATCHVITPLAVAVAGQVKSMTALFTHHRLADIYLLAIDEVRIVAARTLHVVGQVDNHDVVLASHD